MAQNEPLDSSGREVEIGPLIVRTPGFEGEAVLLDAADVDSRGQQLGTDELLAAMAETDVSQMYTLELADLRRIDDDSADGRDEDVEPELVVSVPAPASDEGQILMLVEEDGAITWHLPDEAEALPDSRDRQMINYRIPARTVAPSFEELDPEDRGILSAIGSKVLKILTFPLTPILRAAGTAFTKAWETDHRPARFRPFTSADYTDPEAADLTAVEWRRLTEGPALLFVHGTFSSAHNAFTQLPPDVLDELSARYDGRVFALDHHSVWLTPAQNAQLAAAMLPPGLSFEVDIVSHSRGGLVSRELAERGAEAGSGALNVRRLVMVATPNAGTALAEEANIKKWLDIITNIAQFVPDNPVTDILALVLTVLKQLSLGVFSGLYGLTSMDPASPYLATLNVNADSDPTYFAIAANYEPAEGSGLKRIAQDLAVDLLFSGNENDLVVPTAGVGVIPGLAWFDPETATFDSSHALDHSSYFGKDVVIEKLREWLPG